MKERIAKENQWLTNTTVENEAERIFVKKVSGYGDLDNLFTEWSEEQKAEWEREHPRDINEQEEQL